MRLSTAFITAVVGLASASLSPAEPTKVDYSGHRVYRFVPSSSADANLLERRLNQYHYNQGGRSLDVVVPPHDVVAFEAEHPYARLINPDLGAVIRAAEKPPTYRRELQERGELPGLSWFDTYHDYADHLTWWDDVVAALPENAEKTNLGQSYEGRDIFAFNLWGSEGKKEDKPAVILHATVHAREWISTMVSFCLRSFEAIGFLVPWDEYK